MNRGKNGEVLLVALIVLALIGGGLFVAKPKWLHGDSKRAATATKTTDVLIEADQKKAATAAASVVKIGEANALAPASPAKEFIAREVPVALASLPAPDASALIAAEQRKVAVLEGRLSEASGLYGEAMHRAETLERERAAAISAKRASDDELQRVAAERLGSERQANQAIAVAAVVGLLYAYTKFTHVGPGALAEAVSDMRAHGAAHGIAALDGVTTRLQQKIVRFIGKITTHVPPENAPR